MPTRAAVFRSLCDIADVPCQYFVNHSDVAGGSTLGNILTSQIPLRGVDGAPHMSYALRPRNSLNLRPHRHNSSLLSLLRPIIQNYGRTIELPRQLQQLDLL